MPRTALEEAYDACVAGDIEAARRILNGRLAQGEDPDARDLLAFVDDLEAGQVTAFPRTRREEVEEALDLVPFRCLACGHDRHRYAEALANTRWVTFFGYDHLNAGARTVTCRRCHHVSWFFAAAPGALQALGDPDDERAKPSDAPGFRCLVCRFGRAERREAQLNRALLTFLGLEFLNRSASCDVCVRCGHGHWMRGRTAWTSRAPARPAGKAFSCLSCGGTGFDLRKGQLNHRITTAIRLDFLDPTAICPVCRDCGALHWVANDSYWQLTRSPPATPRPAGP